MRQIIVEDDEKIRIDAYIAKKQEDLSRSNIQKLIQEGNVLVNDKKVKMSYKVQNNDKITINEPMIQEIELKPQDIPIEIIYQDDDIAIVNKPKGMVVHPGAGNHENTLVNALLLACKDSLSGINGSIRPGIVHRLDKDTSGVLIVAKNNISHIKLSEQIKNRQVKKTYIALVRGMTKENEATINMPIARSKTNRQKMAVDREGKNAVTHFKVLKRYDKYTLLEVNIETRKNSSNKGTFITNWLSYCR